MRASTEPRRLGPIYLLAVAAAAWLFLASAPAIAGTIRFAQPFQVFFSRSEPQVIAFLQDNPRYAAVEAFITERPGQEPLIRAVLTLPDGVQIDHVNDPLVAFINAATFIDRPVFFRPITYQAYPAAPGLGPRAVISFRSYLNEEITLDVTGATPQPTNSSLINPFNHSERVSLPVMWSVSTLGDPSSQVIIDGVSWPILPGPEPGTVLGIYSFTFDIGVFRYAAQELTLIDGPRHIAVGAAWTFVDHTGTEQRYEVTLVQGTTVILRKTTGSEEIIEAQISGAHGDALEVRRLRLTGLPASAGVTPPPPAGLTLDLTTPGLFTISIDEHANLVSGTVEAYRDKHGSITVLRPTQPSWAVPRFVTAYVTFDHHGDASILDTIGDPCP
jgi:hypothetical protein